MIISVRKINRIIFWLWNTVVNIFKMDHIIQTLRVSAKSRKLPTLKDNKLYTQSPLSRSPHTWSQIEEKYVNSPNFPGLHLRATNWPTENGFHLFPIFTKQNYWGNVYKNSSYSQDITPMEHIFTNMKMAPNERDRRQGCHSIHFN